MKTDIEVDDGHKILDDLLAAHKGLVLSNANEADTRFKVIDSTLRKVLGWHDDDISGRHFSKRAMGHNFDARAGSNR